MCECLFHSLHYPSYNAVEYVMHARIDPGTNSHDRPPTVRYPIFRGVRRIKSVCILCWGIVFDMLLHCIYDTIRDCATLQIRRGHSLVPFVMQHVVCRKTKCAQQPQMIVQLVSCELQELLDTVGETVILCGLLSGIFPQSSSLMVRFLIGLGRRRHVPLTTPTTRRKTCHFIIAG